MLDPQAREAIEQAGLQLDLHLLGGARPARPVGNFRIATKGSRIVTAGGLRIGGDGKITADGQGSLVYLAPDVTLKDTAIQINGANCRVFDRARRADEAGHPQAQRRRLPGGHGREDDMGVGRVHLHRRPARPYRQRLHVLQRCRDAHLRRSRHLGNRQRKEPESPRRRHDLASCLARQRISASTRGRGSRRGRWSASGRSFRATSTATASMPVCPPRSSRRGSIGPAHGLRTTAKRCIGRPCHREARRLRAAT